MACNCNDPFFVWVLIVKTDKHLLMQKNKVCNLMVFSRVTKKNLPAVQETLV